MTLRMRTMGAVAVAAVASATLTAQTVQINGAGATFPYPIYSKWFSEYNKSTRRFKSTTSRSDRAAESARSLSERCSSEPPTDR